MTLTQWFIILIACLTVVIIISTIVIDRVAIEECKKIVIPDYHTMLRRMNDYQYRDKSCRVAAQSIAQYKTSGMQLDFDINDLTDYALHLIVTTNAAKDNISKIHFANHPSFVNVVTKYDQSAGQFDSQDIRIIANSIFEGSEYAPSFIVDSSDKAVFELLTKLN